MDDLAFRSTVGLANFIRKRKISGREILDHYVSRID